MVGSRSATAVGDSDGSAPAKVAVIGCGYWGRNLVRNFAELGALEALVDVHTPTVEDLRARYGGRASSFEMVLQDPAIQAVAIAVPAASHFNVAKKALEAGKHVFVEKPIALTVAEAEALCTLADQLDRRLMVGHLLQYHPVFLALKDLVRDGRLGRLRYIYSNRLNLGKFRREEDVLWSFAPHDVSMILSLIGAEPQRVTCTGGYFLHQQVADVTTTHMAFPGGEQAHVFVSWLHPFKEQKLIVVGSEGMAVFDDGEAWDCKLLLYPHRIEWRDNLPTPSKAEAVPILVTQAEPLRQECQHFLDCIARNSTPRTDGREGLRVLRVLARASATLAQSINSAATDDFPNIAPAAEAPRVVGNHPDVRIHESAYVDDGVTIGKGTSIWHFSHILGQVTIGTKCSIGQNVVIGPKVRIGNGVKLQNNVSVYEGVTLEDGVFCGPSCVFTNVMNPRAEIVRKSEFRPTLVKQGATIGANATIVCGHTLGAYSFIAAGAVVTNNVPAFALMAGVPAKRIGWMSRAGARLGAGLVCPIDGTRYRKTNADSIEEIE